MTHNSAYVNTLETEQQKKFEQRISLFAKLKTFTLKGEKDYELEEDSKCLIAHEFQRLTMGREDYIYKDYDQIVVYNHPFPTPNIEVLHAAEIFSEDGVIILSREQLINGFFDPTQINIALLLAIMTFIESNPRLQYPDVSDIDMKDLVSSHDLSIDPFKAILGVDHIKKLDLLIYCYVEYPELFEKWNKEAWRKLDGIFLLYAC